jgi:L-alanine-DL-glutamate epimerase-like enolase superfamily enzyme
VEDVVVMMHTDTGNIGYGEAPATAVITGDTHGSIIDAIRYTSRPRLIGREVADLNRKHAHRAVGDGEEHQRQGGGGDRAVRPVRADVRRAAVQGARPAATR